MSMFRSIAGQSFLDHTNTPQPSEYVPPRTVWTSQPGRQSPLSPLSAEHPSSPVRGGDDYYEDVEPRFSEPAGASNPGMPPQLLAGTSGELPKSTSSESLPEGPRSPAASDISHYTSISERPVNPLWGDEAQRRAAPAPTRSDMLLSTNPDFTISSGRRRRGAGPMPMLQEVRGSSRYASPT